MIRTREEITSLPGASHQTRKPARSGRRNVLMELATKLVVAIEGYNLHDGLPANDKRDVHAQNVRESACHAAAGGAQRLLNASTGDVFTLDLENGVVIEQEIGTHADPDYVLLHTIDISDGRTCARRTKRRPANDVNSEDPRIQRQSVRMNLAKIVEFYNRYFLDLEGVSLGDEPYHSGRKAEALSLL